MTQNLLVMKDAESQNTRASPMENNHHGVLNITGAVVETSLNNPNNLLAVKNSPAEKSQRGRVVVYPLSELCLNSKSMRCLTGSLVHELGHRFIFHQISNGQF